MGIGLHGGAVDAIKWLVSKGASVVATDKRSRKQLKVSLDKLAKLKNLKIIAGQHRMEDFESVDMVVKNPGIPWKDKYIQAAMKKKIPVETDSSLFFRFCPTEKIIGVTGTKGKTTTALLVSHIFKNSGENVVEAGIGQKPVLGKLEQIKGADDWVVFELSSWRLSALKYVQKSPAVALITNIYPDHLNYYSSMERYISDKENIFAFQKEGDFLLLNHDNEHTEEFRGKAKGSLGFFSLSKNEENVSVFADGGEIKYSYDGSGGLICPAGNFPLKGKHNLQNALAATLVGIVAGIGPEKIKQALETFSPISHRLEFVAEINGATYFNDSAATTPESAIAGIGSFSNPLVLVCGGADKNLDLSALGERIASDQNIGKVIFLKGSATKKLEQGVKENGGWDKVVGTFDDFEEALEAARQNAKVGDSVLLSPGCASFGMFANEFDRGDRFREIVKRM